MTSSPSEISRRKVQQEMDLLYLTGLCENLIVRWYCLLDYDALDEWFLSNRCCVPLSLSRMLDKRVIKQNTTI